MLDLPNAQGLAVDWISRNLFWTSYDTNKKQINVARLDGSFKNAVIHGLDKPHSLVLHPILGLVQVRTHAQFRLSICVFSVILVSLASFSLFSRPHLERSRCCASMLLAEILKALDEKCRRCSLVWAIGRTVWLPSCCTSQSVAVWLMWSRCACYSASVPVSNKNSEPVYADNIKSLNWFFICLVCFLSTIFFDKLVFISSATGSTSQHFGAFCWLTYEDTFQAFIFKPNQNKVSQSLFMCKISILQNLNKHGAFCK